MQARLPQLFLQIRQVDRLDQVPVAAGIAQGQLKDYEARIGQSFAHADYLERLTVLRDQFKVGLSRAEPQDGAPPVSELAERIRVLRAENTVEATPERAGTRRVSAEVPVTARIMRRVEEPTESVEPVEVVGEREARKVG
jgi:hypothetical protein